MRGAGCLFSGRLGLRGEGPPCGGREAAADGELSPQNLLSHETGDLRFFNADLSPPLWARQGPGWGRRAGVSP